MAGSRPLAGPRSGGDRRTTRAAQLALVLGATVWIAGCGDKAPTAPGIPYPPVPSVPGQGPASLSGIVTGDGVPIPGVRVTVKGASALTDANGRYAFGPVDPPVTHLQILGVEKDGFRFGDASGVPANELFVHVKGTTLQDFLGFRVPRLSAGASVAERLELAEPASPGEWGFWDDWVLGECKPCQVFLVDVDRPGHLFITVTWREDRDLALWVTGQSGPRVGRQSLLRDVPVDRAGVVECLLGGSRSWDWTPVVNPIELEITTRFVPD